mmetsp:Transcript_20747/g.29222  ORF Transcript_20747/g.29222 Transcript_20747/m.29222 type:complete len:159 (+) Transcript_20747:98-574(+)
MHLPSEGGGLPCRAYVQLLPPDSLYTGCKARSKAAATPAEDEPWGNARHVSSPLPEQGGRDRSPPSGRATDPLGAQGAVPFRLRGRRGQTFATIPRSIVKDEPCNPGKAHVGALFRRGEGGVRSLATDCMKDSESGREASLASGLRLLGQGKISLRNS